MMRIWRKCELTCRLKRPRPAINSAFLMLFRVLLRRCFGVLCRQQVMSVCQMSDPQTGHGVVSAHDCQRTRSNPRARLMISPPDPEVCRGQEGSGVLQNSHLDGHNVPLNRPLCPARRPWLSASARSFSTMSRLSAPYDFALGRSLKNLKFAQVLQILPARVSPITLLPSRKAIFIKLF
jgi:hypothetical protein